MSALRASGRNVSWLLPASVSFMPERNRRTLAQRASGTAVEMPADPAYASAATCGALAGHDEVIDGAQRARFGIEHQQPRLGPLHLAPLLRLQQVREIARRTNSPSMADLRQVDGRAVQPDRADSRARAWHFTLSVSGSTYSTLRCDFRALVSRPAALCSTTTRVVSTGIASSTPAVVCAPPQDSATRVGGRLAHADAFADQALHVGDRHQQQHDQTTDHQ